MLKDPDQNTIRLETLTNVEKASEWQKKLVKQKQLWTFINKYHKVLAERIIIQQNKLVQEMNKLSIQPTPQTTPQILEETNMTQPQTRDKILQKYPQLFIRNPKAKRIAYQTCKPIEDKFKYLMDLD
jgi:dGTP triphosphohydrolase